MNVDELLRGENHRGIVLETNELLRNNEQIFSELNIFYVEDILTSIIEKEISKATDLAEDATTVKGKWPKFFNPLLRKQNVYNRKIILALRESLLANKMMRIELNKLKNELELIKENSNFREP